MAYDRTYALIVAATVADGMLAGASLDQSIKQLPARHRIGAVAFSAYSRAADLGPGIPFYAALGQGAALLTGAAAVSGLRGNVPPSSALPLRIAAALAVAHSLATARAAPTNFSQRRVPADDEIALSRIFDRFARWQSLRVVLQVLNVIAMAWACVAYGDAGERGNRRDR